MLKNYLFLLSFISVVNFGFSQNIKLTNKAEVSIITVGPGENLYEAFGHSTIRIKDSSLQLDLAYNYGIFDFSEPNFYLNFTKGKMLYKLASYPFHYFVRGYNEDKRWIKEQVLNLTSEEKQQFFNYLQTNATPKNASYLYDPFFDNCATKMVDVTKQVLGNKVHFSDSHLNSSVSIRQLMNKEIPWNTWGSFGINLALGSKLDQEATQNYYNFLPDYVFKAFENATVSIDGKKQNLVKEEKVILSHKELEQQVSVISPLLVFLLITFLGLWITYKDYKKQKRTKILDFLLLFCTGIMGILIAFLWFFTDHSTTPKNFNFLWAFAPNIVLSFYVLKDNLKKWNLIYIKVLVFMLLIIPFVWIFKIQELPLAIIPFLILLLIRYIFITRLLPFKK